MGTWGSGMFDSDNAQDYLDIFLSNLFLEIHEKFESFHRIAPEEFLDQGDRTFLPALDIYTTLLIEYDGAPKLELEVFKKWRTFYFDIFDKDDTINRPSFKKDRREAIEELFDKLEKYLLNWYSTP